MKRWIALALVALPLGLAHAQSTGTDSHPGGIKQGIKDDAHAVKRVAKEAWNGVRSGTKSAWHAVKNGAHEVKTDVKHAFKGDKNGHSASSPAPVQEVSTSASK
jgi:hypothetical protein